MVDNSLEKIKCNDINYAIYTIGNWKNDYEINLIGVSNEIPATNVCKDHVLFNMEQIRKSVFETEGEELNGILALAKQLNPNLNEKSLEDLRTQEEKEYKNILEEINNLDLLNDEDSVNLDSEEYLIYKLEKEEHSITTSKPANKFTSNHHLEEIKKLKGL